MEIGYTGSCVSRLCRNDHFMALEVTITELSVIIIFLITVIAFTILQNNNRNRVGSEAARQLV